MLRVPASTSRPGLRLGIAGAVAALSLILTLGLTHRPVYYAQPILMAILALHVVASCVTLVVLPVNMLAIVRTRLPRTLHRHAGRLMCVSGIAAAGSSLLLSGVPQPGGTISQFSFAAASVVWGIAAWRTLVHGAAGRRQSHRSWAARFAAMGLNFIVHAPLAMVAQLCSLRVVGDARPGLVVADTLSWPLLLLTAEWWRRVRFRASATSRFQKPKTSVRPGYTPGL